MMSQISPGVPSGVIEHRLEAYAEKQAGTARLLVSKASRLTRLNRLEMSKLQSPGKSWAKLSGHFGPQTGTSKLQTLSGGPFGAQSRRR